MEAIQDLPPAVIEDVAQFLFFVKQRDMGIESLADAHRSYSLFLDLQSLRRDEENHLVQEFAGYDREYPRK